MNEFELAIKSHLDKVASEDTAFAEKYRTKCEVENDSIEKCCNYIISEVQKLKRQAMTDAEVFGMAMHYFDENITFDGQAPQCNVVVPHESLSEEDQERIRRQAQEEIERDAVEQAKKKILEAKKQEEEKARKKAEKARKKAEEAERKRKELLEKQKEEYSGGGLLFGFDD